MHGILSYEERVRLERANGIREPNQCHPAVNRCGMGCPSEAVDKELEGMTYAELAETPVPANRSCPHTKVIVPAYPAVLINPNVIEITPTSKTEDYRVVDFNPCDGRSNLDVIKNDRPVKNYETVVEVGTMLEDTPYDLANEVPAVSHTVKEAEDVSPVVHTDGSVVAEKTWTGNDKVTTDKYVDAAATFEKGQEDG